jgi:hypothetical protein
MCCRCDNITISPQLLGELESSTDPLPRKLWPQMGGCTDPQYSGIDEDVFSKLHGTDEMAVEKLKQVKPVLLRPEGHLATRQHSSSPTDGTINLSCRLQRTPITSSLCESVGTSCAWAVANSRHTAVPETQHAFVLLLLLLLQGIDSFAADQNKLEEQLAKLATA